MNNPTKIIVHHTAVSRRVQKWQFFPVNNYHKSLNFLKSRLGYYGGYHIFIEPNGAEFRYKFDDETGCHTKGQNEISLGVCLAGNFDIEMPTSEQIATLKTRLKKWKEKYNINIINIVPHRKFANKTCYGYLLDESWAQDLLEPQEINVSKEEAIKDMSSKLERLKEILLRLQIIINSLIKK